MHLMLRVHAKDPDRTVDLRATAEPTHTVEALRDALAGFLEVRGGVALFRLRTGQALERSSTLAAAGVVSGEELLLAPPSTGLQVPREGRTILAEAVGGPHVGWRVVLGPGRHVLGRRFPGCEADDRYHAIPDNAVSRAHVAVEVADDLTVAVTENPEATNPMLVDRVRSSGPVVVGESTEVRVGDTVLVFRLSAAPSPAQVDQLGQLAFHRTPLRPARPRKVELAPIGKVPPKLEPPRFSWLTTAAPLLGGVVLAAVMRRPEFLIFTVLAPITGAAGYFESRKRGRKGHEQEVEAFERRFADREAALAAAFAEEAAVRIEAAPDIADLRRRSERRDRTLWARGRGLDEFLLLRVGLGPSKPNIVSPPAPDGDEGLLERLEAQAQRYSTFESVPTMVPLVELGVIGIHGPVSEAPPLAKALLVQAATLHSPEDLVIAGAAAPETGLVDWLRWLPHTNSTGSPIGGPHLASDREAADDLLRSLLEVAEFRALGSDHGVDRRWPWILAVVDRRLEPDPHLLAQVLDRCPGSGVSVLWLSETADRLPPQCRAVADLADRSQAGPEQLSRLWFTDPEVEPQVFAADGADRALPDGVARALAPLRDASSATATASIPRVVPLFAVHGVDEVGAVWVEKQWAVDRQTKDSYRVEAVVGLTGDGPLSLDLVADGPHGLIGGTSGAGKSELIQALVAGLVAYQSPRDLSLLFIDFKGGSASEVFKDLPHVSGRVTDLDESLAMRAQVSLRAELRARLDLFSKLKVKDMAEMRHKHAHRAPPSLVIVIDEFATLVKQLPDFVADLIDIAQRGRSYGVHLLLATQRPSSSVDDNILANTNLRISLRMLDRAESMSILNAPDAAEIPVPLKGRSIARMGPGQLVEFQSAYCSAPLALTKGLPPVRIEPLAAAARSDGAEPAAGVRGEKPRTQLDALVEAIVGLGHPRVPQIWNDLLPERLTLAAADQMQAPGVADARPGRTVLLGGVDDPANRVQHQCLVDLEVGGGLLILGTAGSGKTSALRTIAASVARDDLRAGGGRAMFFVLDFTSGELRSLVDLPQCGGVGTIDDLEATTRILETLADEVARRRNAVADASGSSGRPPTIVLLVDGYSNLVDALQNTKVGQEQSTDVWLEGFHRVVIDGRQLGVHTVMTADRSSSVRTSVFAAVTKRLVLRQVDPAETMSFGLPSTQTFKPGAGYLDGLRVQVATLSDLADDAPSPAEGFASRVRSEVERMGVEIPPIVQPPLPTLVALAGDLPRAPMGGVIGVADITGRPVAFDCDKLDVLVTGPPGSGKTWALRCMAEQLEEGGASVFAMGAEDSGLRSFRWTAGAWGVAEAAGLLATMKVELQFPRRTAVLVVDDLELLQNPELDAAVQGLGQDRRVRVLGAMTAIPGFSNNEVVKRVTAARQVLYLQPGSSREVAERVGVMRLPTLRLGLPMPAGRGMFVRSRIAAVIQTYAPRGTST